MMDKKLKGFSLAELLISLLIISLVLSAAIPTLTKKSGASREFIWRWSSDGNNNAYFGNGINQSAIIGYDKIPLKDTAITDLFNKANEDAEKLNLDNVQFTTNGDKLVLLKRVPEGVTSVFANSHISLYSVPSAQSNQPQYAGRIVADPENIAFGIGTLQSKGQEGQANSAIGHYSLLRNTIGAFNTALGYKTLSFNLVGSANTALGYKSLYSLESSSTNSGVADDNTDSHNTAIGNLSLAGLQLGNRNVALGSNALSYMIQGNDNIAIGTESLISLNGNILNKGNVALGSGACSSHTSGNYNICIGNHVGEKENSYSDSYGLYIGSSEQDSKTDVNVPLIEGHTQKTNSNDKELIVNAKKFSVKSYDGGTNIFQVNAYTNSAGVGLKGDGYGITPNNGYTGEIFMHLRGDSGSGISLNFMGENKYNKNYAVIGSYDSASSDDTYVNLSFNNVLDLNFPHAKKEGESDNVSSLSLIASQGHIFNINDQIELKKEDDAPTLKLNKDYGFYVETNNGSGQLQLQTNSSQTKFKVNSDNVFLDDTILMLTDNEGNGYATISNTSTYFSALNGVTGYTGGSSGGNLSLSGELTQDLKDIMDAIGKLYDAFIQQSTSSDARLKNISGNSKAGLKEINALEVKNFTYKKDKDKTPHVGVIAQQLIKIFPNSVFKDKDGYYRINTDEIFYAMVNSIKELCSQIQDLTAKITGLDKRITELEKQNQMLKQQNAEFEKRLSKLEKASK